MGTSWRYRHILALCRRARWKRRERIMSLTALTGGAVHLCTQEIEKPSATIGFMLFMDCIDLHLLSFESKIKKRCTFGNFVDSLEKRKHVSNNGARQTIVQWRFPGFKLKGVFAATVSVYIYIYIYIYIIYTVSLSNIGTLDKYEQKAAVKINLHCLSFWSFTQKILTYHWNETIENGEKISWWNKSG